MFVMKADTPEELKIAIVAWLKYNAANNGTQSTISKNKTTAKEKRIISDTYLAAAQFIQQVQIERKS